MTPFPRDAGTVRLSDLNQKHVPVKHAAQGVFVGILTLMITESLLSK
jgi:hypothetical protein